jgi:protein-tyrosine phosphatase
MADPASLPLLLHCTAGKDRTGIAVAFLYVLLGVPEDVIVADYTLTNLHYDRILRVAREDVKRLRSVGITADELRPLMSADARYLRALFDHVRARHGSVEAYLREAAGVGPDMAQELRANLLTR